MLSLLCKTDPHIRKTWTQVNPQFEHLKNINISKIIMAVWEFTSRFRLA